MRRLVFGLIATSLLAVAAPCGAQAQSCFYPNQWTSWKAPDDHTIFLKVGARVFRLDIGGSCPALRTGGVLVTNTRSTQLCSAIDWDLRVREGGISTRCIVDKMTQLTPDQVEALPPAARP